MRRKVKYFLPFYLFTFLLSLSSCGEFWEFGGQELVTASDMTLDRKVVNVMVGDYCVIPVNFDPDSLSNTQVFWLTEDDTVAYFHGDTLRAVGEGHTRALAFTSIDRLRDTCLVNVIPAFREDVAHFPYDMVVYADVNIHGLHLTPDNADDMTIAAFVNDEMRGIGKMRRHAGVSYMELRVWSPFDYGDDVTFRCYYHGQGRMEVFAEHLTFDGAQHGTLSKLYPLVLDERAVEYVPDFDEYNPYIEDSDTIHVVIGEGE
jgi:hypothetical protein